MGIALLPWLWQLQGEFIVTATISGGAGGHRVVLRNDVTRTVMQYCRDGRRALGPRDLLRLAQVCNYVGAFPTKGALCGSKTLPTLGILHLSPFATTPHLL